MTLLCESKIDPKTAASLMNWWNIFQRGLDLSIQAIWGLLVKGLQSYWLSNFEYDLEPAGSNPGQVVRLGPG